MGFSCVTAVIYCKSKTGEEEGKKHTKFNKLLFFDMCYLRVISRYDRTLKAKDKEYAYEANLQIF